MAISYHNESRGCLRFKASKGEAVVNTCESLATQKMGYHRLFPKVNKMGWFLDNLDFTRASIIKKSTYRLKKH
jgi:hypothetical protein